MTNAVQPSRIDIVPFLPVAQTMIYEALLPPIQMVVTTVDSAPLLNILTASLKSFPNAFFSDSLPLISDFDNGMSCRFRYLEATMMAGASAIYNFVFATFFSVLSLVTLGQIKAITDQTFKMWIHTALAVASIGIGAIGIVSPKLGIQANLIVFGAAVLLLPFLGSGVVRNISTVYQNHRAELETAAMASVNGNRAVYEREIMPLLTYLDGHLNDDFTTIEDLTTVAQGSLQLMRQSAGMQSVVTDGFSRLTPLVTELLNRVGGERA